jgi:hypothetical protein
MAEGKAEERWHLSLAVGNELWKKLLQATLPIRIAEGHFDVVTNVRQVARQLEVRERVRGLIAGANPPDVLLRVQRRAQAALSERREAIEELIDELVHVEGDWRVQIDQEGSTFHGGQQRVGLEAWIRGEAEGTARFLWRTFEFPFKLERRAGAVLHLEDIRYDPERKAVIGDLGGLSVDIGENVLFQLLSQLAQVLLERQLPKASPLEILKRDQVEALIAPLGGPLKVDMGVENLVLEVDEHTVTLRVRLGFTQKQIEGA